MCKISEDDDDDSPSLSKLPDEIVLECLLRVPRRYYENLSCVSPKLRSLVRSPELHRMRSLLHKDPIYICFCDRDNYSTGTNYQWFTLRQSTTEKEKKFQLVSVPFPSRFFMFNSASVAVDSEIYFIGKDLWILNTKSGELRQGPIMREARNFRRNAVGVADDKIYVVQELRNGEIGEEVFDIESGNWEVSGVLKENLVERRMMQSSVTLEGKVYAMLYGDFSTVYNLRKGRRKEKFEMPVDEIRVWSICVVDYLLFACFRESGLMWLDTKCDVWKVVGGDGVQRLGSKLYSSVMVEYYGKLAIFWRERDRGTRTRVEKIWCEMIGLDRVGDGIRGTIEWSGVVATIPSYVCRFLHCLAASD